MSQQLVIRGKIITLNEYINAERSNKFAAAKIKHRETERVAWECKAQRIKPVEKITKVVFSYYHKDHRLDFDNIEVYQKFVWDGLVVAGIIPDDTQEYTPNERTHIHSIDKSDPRIEVTIFS